MQKKHGRISKMQIQRMVLLCIICLAIAACMPEGVPTLVEESPAVTTEKQILAISTLEPTASSTPEPGAIPTGIPEPSATTQYYDTFVSQLSGDDVKVVYSPSVVYTRDQLNAAIYLPVEIPGAHGLPFSEIYYVTVEVYTQGAGEFEGGLFTGTRVTLRGEAEIGGSSREGNLIIKWKNPTYSGDISYIYIFNIYPLVNAMQAGKGAKLARLQGVELLQQVTLAGMPDATSQVMFYRESQGKGNGDEEEETSPPTDPGPPPPPGGGGDD